MHIHLPHFLADISNLPWVAIIAVGGGMLVAIVVIVGGLIIAHHRQKLWHETARLALEKGQPLPVQQDVIQNRQTDQPASGPGRDLRAGLILIAVGAGLYIFLGSLVGQRLGFVGAIPGFIGLALLLYALLSSFSKDKDAPPADRS
jgi:small-conductance mechanosensitive channel